MSCCYFVYYRVPAEHTGLMRVKVADIFRDIERDAGVAGRLMRRRDESGTWMEIYDAVADSVGFEAALDAAVARHEFARVLAAGAVRKNEVFQAA